MYLVRNIEPHLTDYYLLRTTNVQVRLSEEELVDFYRRMTTDLKLWGILPDRSDNHLVPRAPE